MIKLTIPILEQREQSITWFKGIQQHAVVERYITTAKRDKCPTVQEIGAIEPGQELYGYSNLRPTTTTDGKGRFQRRVFFRVLPKPGVTIITPGDATPSDRMMRPSAGMHAQIQGQVSKPATTKRTGRSTDRWLAFLTSAGAFGEPLPPGKNKTRRPGIPDICFGG